MKKYISYLITFILIGASFNLAQDSSTVFTFTPQKPKPGDQLTISFNPPKTSLKKEKNVDVIIYSVKESIIICEEYPMFLSETGWSYKYLIADTVWCLGIKFSSEKTVVDDNGKNFAVLLYENDDNFLLGTKAAYAFLCNAAAANVKTDTKFVYSYFNEEFKNSPQLIRYYLQPYTRCIKAIENVKADEMIRNILQDLESEKEPDEKMLNTIAFTYLIALRDQTKYDYYNNLVRKKYPLGYFSQSAAFIEINKMSSTKIEELERAISKFIADFGEKNSWLILLRGKLLKAYCEQKMYSKAENFLTAYKNEFNNITGISLVNSAAKAVYDNQDQLSLARKLIEFSLTSLKGYKSGRDDFRGLTKAQIEEQLNRYRLETQYTAGLIYEKTDGANKALDFVQEAYSFGKPTDDLKILHAKLLLELKQNVDEVLKITEEMLSTGKTSDAIIDLNREAFKLVYGSEEVYEKYFSGFKGKFLENLTHDIKKEMIDKSAPEFSLTDLDGKKISLSDYKGKIVILDFWATWCGPCKASFPLMKEAIQKYTDSEKVKFLFVDTFERVNNKIENAKKFIAENNYPFQVLLDVDSKAANDYGVVSIPTKIFIDKNGNQRFISVGFEKEKILDEIDILIKLLEN